ncbi:MAG TPA: GNAT family N-acetyltransferase [Candidatus Nanoarchaeia archaeon]|nr:GNAT family N-acetyltransferase [Candidatus Nanoarchaeia archaeon]
MEKVVISCPRPSDYLRMYHLSNKERFTKWGFFKQVVLSPVVPGWDILVAKANGDLAGFIFLRDRSIYRLCVNALHRGKGIGKKLIPSHALFSETNRKDAVKFWEASGFRMVRESKGVWKFERR